MSSLSKRAFSGTNFNMNSNTRTNINQGGGSKKAGFPYQVGHDSWTTINLRHDSHPLTLWNTTIFPLARQSRPIGSRYTSNYRYWHIPGLGQ
jgi:hypothetical protein